MNIFRRFAHRWAMYKTYSDFKEHAATATVGELIAHQMDHQHAPNYVEMTFCTRDDRKFVVTVRRLEGKTPHQLRVNAQARAQLLENHLRELISAANNNSGFEPSLSVFNRAVYQASEFLAELDKAAGAA